VESLRPDAERPRPELVSQDEVLTNIPALLPLGVLSLLVAALRCGRGDGEADFREDLLHAALIVGVSIGLGTELLGAFHAIDFDFVLGFWLVWLAVAGVALAWRWHRAGAPARFRIPSPGAVDRMLLGGIAVVALLTLLVAWLSPPQSSDSISYHMGRVMHWIQNRSLEPYPTHDSRQLFDPPLAEMVRLHLQLLTGADRAGCLLQWLASMGSLVAVSLVARDFGGGRRAQIFAAVFAVTLPIGVTQATSGKNDWLGVFWLLVMVYFSGVVISRRELHPTTGSVFCSVAALGLALATKLMAFFIATPLAIVAIARTPRASFRRLIVAGAGGILLTLALITPFMRRNLTVYGNPAVDPGFHAIHALKPVTPATIFSNALRNVAFQMGTTKLRANAALLKIVTIVHRLVGLDPSDPRTSVGKFRIPRPSTVEEIAGNPIHILLMAVLIVTLAFRRGESDRGTRLVYFASLTAGYLLFCATMKWEMATARLLLPFPVLAAPLAGVLAVELFGGEAAVVLAAALIVGCARYAVGTRGRPLSLSPGRGILVTSRRDLYFARVPEVRPAYEEVARVVRDNGVHNLGLVFTSWLQPEYLLWVLLGDVKPPVRIENVAVTDASGALASRAPFSDFHPDLIVEFASNPRLAQFPLNFVVAGAKYPLVRVSGSVGFYSTRPLATVPIRD
jgi:hypothetical protein